MKKVGELVFEAFDVARKSRRLKLQTLVDEGVIPYRKKIYAV